MLRDRPAKPMNRLINNRAHFYWQAKGISARFHQKTVGTEAPSQLFTSLYYQLRLKEMHEWPFAQENTKN